MVQAEAHFPARQDVSAPHCILAPDGTIAAGVTPTLSGSDLADAMELMLLTRMFDDKAMRLQRQGRFGTFSQVRGQEAAVTGSAAALDPSRDWVVPQYRELPALLRQGFPLEHFILYFLGDPRGAEVPQGVRCLPLNIALASQLPHAVGLAWGLRRQDQDGVVLAYFGDGASSEGDAHEAMNLAGILKAPVVFLLSNNGWAISTPRSKQSAATSLAARAPGYGMPGILVDGNDLLAVHQVTAEAVARARAGDGPTLIEAITYRVGPHNTADDPSRYVDPAERDSWLGRDPISRVEQYLTTCGLWSKSIAAAVEERNRETVDGALAAAASRGAPTADLLFDHLYADAPARIRRQRSEFTGQGR
ncbi:thiamine pyrophosphate-dependent enzyme [Dactylosporangium sp. NPDC051484]|uniref:thiamine pyrophosphate-dependent enzyme n=1 Tax=Dactylosporangium sp. NPDC051484 TaxID=3154942 RepID=UPI00344B890A